MIVQPLLSRVCQKQIRAILYAHPAEPDVGAVRLAM